MFNHHTLPPSLCHQAYAKPHVPSNGLASQGTVKELDARLERLGRDNRSLEVANMTLR